MYVGCGGGGVCNNTLYYGYGHAEQICDGSRQTLHHYKKGCSATTVLSKSLLLYASNRPRSMMRVHKHRT